MKIKISLFLSVLTFFVCMTSCMSDLSEEPTSIDKNKKMPITLGISMPDNEGSRQYTRVSYEESGETGFVNGPILKWEMDDQLAIIGLTPQGMPLGKEVLYFQNYKSQGNQSNAVFKGWTVVGADLYDVYYPAYAVNEYGFSNGKMNYNNQLQNGNGSTAHLKDYIFLTNEGAGKLTTEEILLQVRDVPMTMKNSVMRFILKNLPAIRPQSLTWEIPGKSIILKFKNITLSAGSNLTAYLCFDAFSLSPNDAVTITVKGDNGKSYYYKSTKRADHLDFRSNTRYTSTIDSWETK